MGIEIKLILADILRQRNISRYELAKRSDVPYPTIDRYYRNKIVRYDSEIIRRICLTLDCTPGDLIRLVETDE